MKAADFPIDPSYIGVFKLDRAVTAEEKTALREEVKKLENVPDAAKDWHPGSNQQVLDLVHPSLFPFVVGRTWVLSEPTSDLSRMFERTGSGAVIQEADMQRIIEEARPALNRSIVPDNDDDDDFAEGFSMRYQWLPAEVEIFRHKGAMETKFRSYINNLHPEVHRPMYGAIESILRYCVPLWDRVLADTQKDYTEPVERDGKLTSLRCRPFSALEWYESDDYIEYPGDDFEDDAYITWQETTPPRQPEAAEFEPPPI